MPDKLADRLRSARVIEPAVEADSLAELEREKFDRERQKLDLERQQERLEGEKQDREERKNYATKIFKLVVCWLVGVLALLIAQGIEFIPFQLGESIVLATIGGTTVNVLGLFVIVANYLFPKRTRVGRES